jgi:RNA polymerase sigma factor (sigma-70 family)
MSTILIAQQPGMTPPDVEIPKLAEHLFRHEAGKLVSALTGIFGMARLQLAEDVVQEAMVRALQTWPYHGIPANPAAWLMQTAKNRALDLIRREKSFHDKQPEIVASLDRWSGDPDTAAPPRFDDEIHDDRLRLIFACCHPLIPRDDQTALALRTLCGFSPAEIASAFLTTEAAINKRLTRARQKIRDLGIPFEIPTGAELAPRLDGVLQVLYLLFNEGYKASSGENLVREDLCAEAIRLATLLAGHPSADQPATHALLALMLLNAARLPGRMDSLGNVLRLKEQDRSTWHKPMISQGLLHLARAADGESLSEYHLQAIIAASHATAADDASTDWPGILARYNQWLEINDSPVIALNRAVALAKVHGPAAGIEAVEAIHPRKPLNSYYLVHAVLGEFEAQLGHFQTAVTHLQKALDLAEVKSEQAFLLKQLQGYEAHP